MRPDDSTLEVEVYWRDKPATHVALSLSIPDVSRAVAALERRDGELEVLVTVGRHDGLLIVSATTEGCVGTFQPYPDADWTQLVSDLHRDRADEVDLVLGGQLVNWPRRHLLPVGAAQDIVQQFSSKGPPLPGTWEQPPNG